MLKIRFNTIGFKIAALVGVATFLIVGILITYSVVRLRDTQINAATENALALARDYAGRLKATVEVPLDGSRAFSDGLLGIRDESMPSTITREDVNVMLKNYLVKNPSVLGFYTLWEPDAFDGKDSLYAGTKGHDQTGRFIPYWVRSKDQITVEPLVGYEQEGIGNYCQIPKKTGRETVIDPYLYPVAGKEELLMSLVTPIHDNGQFLGITGADFTLDWLQTLVVDGQKEIFGGLAQLYVISGNGTIAAASGREDLLGKSVSLIFKDYHQRKTHVAGGNFEIVRDTLSTFVPVYFGNAPTPWQFCITLPVTELTRNARAEMNRMIVLSVVFMLIFIVFVLWLLRLQLQPIHQISAVAERVAVGDLSIPQVSSRNAEIESLRASFLKLVQSQRDITNVCALIAKGDFSQQAAVKSEQDGLASSVNQMIDTLKLAAREDQKRNWMTEGLALMGNVLRSDKALDQLSELILMNLVRYLKANQGALFITLGGDSNATQLEMLACYAYDRKKYFHKTIQAGQGLVGQCYLEKDSIYLTDLPGDYVTITSGLGEARPKNVLIVPLLHNGEVEGVIELASFTLFGEHEIAFVQKLAESIAATVSTVKINEKTRRLLDQSQQQAEEMRAQEEEMRQNLEELAATQEEMHRKEQEYLQTIEQLQCQLVLTEKT